MFSLDKLLDALKKYTDENIYKGCGEYIVIMKLLDDSRTNERRDDIVDPMYAKYRTNKVIVIAIINKFSLEEIKSVENSYFTKKNITYVINEIIEVSDYNTNVNVVCGTGIHYFKNIESAFYFTLNVKTYTGIM